MEIISKFFAGIWQICMQKKTILAVENIQALKNKKQNNKNKIKKYMLSGCKPAGRTGLVSGRVGSVTNRSPIRFEPVWYRTGEPASSETGQTDF